MKKMFMLVLASAVSLSLISCGIGGVGTSPQGKEAPIEKSSMKLVADVKAGGYQLVSAEELKKWMDDKKDMIIIDAHPKADYDNAHIKGSINSPFPKTEKELTPADKENLLKIAGDDKDKTIVIYCGFVACRRSHFGAQILIEDGFKNVYRYPGGIVAWKENKFPTN